MSNRKYLRSLVVGYALREAWQAGYKRPQFIGDIVAGITVGIIALPLSMALAIASGVAPQHGLYTAIVAATVIALFGGSRFNISGPTAAFVVILLPITQQFGLSGLLLATMMAGGILVLMALMRLGRFIEYIPLAVTLGFTAGIAVVIAVLQIKDLFGLNITALPNHFVPKIAMIINHMPELSGASMLVATVTLAVMLTWRFFDTRLPAHLPALIIGGAVAYGLNQYGADVATIGSRFSYSLNGETVRGIPSELPTFSLPWHNAELSWHLLSALLPSAFAIAMLGAIESLLSAVVVDTMSNTRHSANSELLGQGIGNIIAPFFGGITATAAIARSAANVSAGAFSPVAAVVHAGFVLLAMVLLGKVLAHVPMPSMAALLLIVAWNMSEFLKALKLIKTAPRSDVLIFLTCMVLTVFFDMVLAIGVGVVLASLLFMRTIAELTKVSDITESKRIKSYTVDASWRVFKINGPLFYAASDRVMGDIRNLSETKNVVLYLDAVPVLDAGGVMSLKHFIALKQAQGLQVVIADIGFQPLKTLARSHVQPISGTLKLYATLDEALLAVEKNEATS